MVKWRSWSAARSMFCPLQWTSTYEEELAGGSQRVSLDLEWLAFFYCGAAACSSRSFSGFPQTRLAAVHLLPPHRLSFGGQRGGPPFAWIRPKPDLFLRVKSRQSFRSVHALLCHSSVRPRLGAGIPFQNSRIRLADEALWECSHTGHSPPVGPEAHVAADARRR